MPTGKISAEDVCRASVHWRPRYTERMLMRERIELRVNGVKTTVQADPDQSLLAVLRGSLGLTGTRFGCGANQCGACTVLVDDKAVASCDTPLWSVIGKDIVTIEGLGTPER